MLKPAEVWSVVRTDKGSAVLVKPVDQETAVPIYIGTMEAQSILIGMLEDPIARPLTHDLLLNSLQLLGAQLVQVEIHTLSEGTFYSSLVIETSEGRKEMDSRPSDALALAVRRKCPIFINQDLVDEVAIPLDLIREVEAGEAGQTEAPWEDEEASSDEPKSRRQELQDQLDQFVAEENYEEAAKIRDELKKLDGESPNS